MHLLKVFYYTYITCYAIIYKAPKISFTSGNLGLALFSAWEQAFTAWASSCSNRICIFAASQILQEGRGGGGENNNEE